MPIISNRISNRMILFSQISRYNLSLSLSDSFSCLCLRCLRRTWNTSCQWFSCSFCNRRSNSSPPRKLFLFMILLSKASMKSESIKLVTGNIGFKWLLYWLFLFWFSMLRGILDSDLFIYLNCFFSFYVKYYTFLFYSLKFFPNN